MKTEKQQPVVIGDPWLMPAGNCEWLQNLTLPENLPELVRDAIAQTRDDRLKSLRPYQTRVTPEDLSRVIG